MDLLDIPGVGAKTAETLTRNGLGTPEQLLAYYPRTHRHYIGTSISNSRVGDYVMLKASLTHPISRHTSRISTQLSTARDESGTLTLRWFNSPFITRSVSDTGPYQILGKLETFAGKKHIVNPTLKKISRDTALPSDLLLPIYTPLGTLKSGNIRNLIKSALEIIELKDPINAELIAANHLYPRQEAIKNIHFPDSNESLSSAIHRLGFDELVALQTESLTLKESMSPATDALNGNEPQLDNWLQNLPFTPTNSQNQAIEQIIADLKNNRAMHRLVVGDVGSGKTLVAAAAALWTILSDKRVLVLAPTQILAEQLYQSLGFLLGKRTTISLITSAQKGNSEANIVVGTHAILSPKHHFTDIGLVIIDEQHRFGVTDREALRTLTPTPHLLMLSATPIPRTLAMTTLSHLDYTEMADMPKNRLRVKTYVVGPDKRTRMYDWIRTEVEHNKQQAFIVTPLIEQADNDEVSPKVALSSLQASLRAGFPHLSIDYVHGKMKAAEKTTRLQRFRDGNTQILVATSMIEVGIDIPGANLIVIENAELFGLATLHQLRGRVGRGGGQGHCVLLTNKTDTKTIERLSYFVRESRGAELAAYDLSKRGPGDIFGTLQSGSLGLRFADLSDPKTLQASKEVALSLAKSTHTS